MVYTIAMAGKGGTGKTTCCGLLIDHLAKQGKGPVLAVDADPNSNLNEVLGVAVETTIGDIREEIARAEIANPSPIPVSMSKKEYADIRFAQAMLEEDNFDLLVMGRTQGQGCYCYVNDLLREQIQRYYKNYTYMVVDNEAGLEHISRGVLPPVDLILLVSDCSRRGVQAAGRIAVMIKDLNLKVKLTGLIVNRAPPQAAAPDGSSLEPGILEEIGLQGLTLLGVLPQDSAIYEYDAAGKPTVSLPADSPVRKALSGILEKLSL